MKAYLQGETCAETLRGLGTLTTYRFNSLREMNAFMLGVDVGSSNNPAIAVDDLYGD